MGSVPNTSLIESLFEKVAMQGKGSTLDNVLTNKLARGDLLDALSQLRLAIEQPEDIVGRVVFFPSTYMCARVAIDLKLFNIIADADRPISSEDLSAETKVDQQLLERLLRGLTIADLVKEVGEATYEANAITRHLKIDSVQAGLVHFYDAGLRSLWSMPDYFKANGYKLPADSLTGPLQYAFDTPLNSYEFWQTEKPEFMDNFNTFMAGKLGGNKTGQTWQEVYAVKENIIDGFDPNISDSLFVDIAGGRGHEVAQLKAKFPKAQGRFVLEDLPGVIDDIHELDSGVERIKYDFFEPQPIKGAKAYFMANIMHNWTDNDCSKILKNVVKAMVKGYSKLLLSDHILPATNCKLESFGRDIGMLSLHSGVERSEKQWTALLEPEGLTIVKFYLLGRGEGLVEAVLKD